MLAVPQEQVRDNPGYLGEVTETLAERFSRLLTEAGISLEQAAAVMGVKIDTTRRIASGGSKSMRLVEGLRLARRLGVSPYYLACLTEDRQAMLPDAEAESMRSDMRILMERMDEIEHLVRRDRGET